MYSFSGSHTRDWRGGAGRGEGGTHVLLLLRVKGCSVEATDGPVAKMVKTKPETRDGRQRPSQPGEGASRIGLGRFSLVTLEPSPKGREI